MHVFTVSGDALLKKALGTEAIFSLLYVFSILVQTRSYNLRPEDGQKYIK